MVILFLDKYSIRRYLIRGKTPAAAIHAGEKIRSHQTAQKLRHLCLVQTLTLCTEHTRPYTRGPTKYLYCCDVLGKYTTLSYTIHPFPIHPAAANQLSHAGLRL